MMQSRICILMSEQTVEHIKATCQGVGLSPNIMSAYVFADECMSG